MRLNSLGGQKYKKAGVNCKPENIYTTLSLTGISLPRSCALLFRYMGNSAFAPLRAILYPRSISVLSPMFRLWLSPRT